MPNFFITGTKTRACTTTLKVVPNPRICTCKEEIESRLITGEKIRNEPNNTIPTMLLAIGAHISGPNDPLALATWPNMVNKPKKKI
ncbi:unannotated protein [freshwater metagenome]|uniref:Unannotated protein n=1 Tax=freshwater metagenome TaxID=449393 RepID=A0A6J7T670_9ZZZZ